MQRRPNSGSPNSASSRAVGRWRVAGGRWRVNTDSDQWPDNAKRGNWRDRKAPNKANSSQPQITRTKELKSDGFGILYSKQTQFRVAPGQDLDHGKVPAGFACPKTLVDRIDTVTRAWSLGKVLSLGDLIFR